MCYSCVGTYIHPIVFRKVQNIDEHNAHEGNNNREKCQAAKIVWNFNQRPERFRLKRLSWPAMFMKYFLLGRRNKWYFYYAFAGRMASSRLSIRWQSKLIISLRTFPGYNS